MGQNHLDSAFSLSEGCGDPRRLADGEKCMHITSPGHGAFAAAMIGLGILGLVYGDFALVWQPVPKGLPLREAAAYACAVLMLAGGVGLLWTRTAALASRVLLAYLLLWLILLRLPRLVMAPLVEVRWLGCGETAVMVAGGWALFACFADQWDRSKLKFATGDVGVRLARFVFGLAIIPCGLSHLVYTPETAELVPAWLPWHPGWAYLTGVAYIAAGIAVLFGVYARLAAMLTACMMTVFTLLIWMPGVVAAPRDRFQWTALLISSALAAGACAVADSYRGTSWRGFSRSGRSESLA
jgi:uncharacterized membrane protein